MLRSTKCLHVNVSSLKLERAASKQHHERPVRTERILEILSMIPFQPEQSQAQEWLRTRARISSVKGASESSGIWMQFRAAAACLRSNFFFIIDKWEV